jgi:hypothetical protein
MDFDMPDAAIGAAIARLKADRQRIGVELQRAARPDGLHPADSELTPHGFISHAGLCSGRWEDDARAASESA